VIHVTLRPLYMWPTWTTPRDFCLMRYWRYDDEDGTYFISYDSTVRARMPKAMERP
jgi:hypothetical protein